MVRGGGERIVEAGRHGGGQATQVAFERRSIGGRDGELLGGLGARRRGLRRDPRKGPPLGVILLAKGFMARDGFVAFRLGGAQLLLELRHRPFQFVSLGLVARDEFVLARLRLHQRRLEGPLRGLQGL